VTFTNGGVSLAGTVVLPRGRGPFPAIVFVHGDGPDTREGYRHLAAQYAAHGVAALIYDKRGTGESTGTFPARFADLAGDAAAGVRSLRGRGDIDAGCIGMWGGSQGGWIAPLVASSPAARIRFLVIKAGPAIGPAELARWKSVSRVQRAGYPPGVIARVNQLMDVQFEILRSGSGWTELDGQVRAARVEPWFPLVAVMRHSSWRSSWMTYGRDIDFDPGPVLARVNAPMLWLLGERDPETPLDATVARLEELRRGGKDITVKVFRGANHQLELPRTATNRPNYAPGYVETQIEWVARHCGTDR
jgi:alpha-beta hydrolase superfamily lysophospholipase